MSAPLEVHWLVEVSEGCMTLDCWNRQARQQLIQSAMLTGRRWEVLEVSCARRSGVIRSGEKGKEEWLEVWFAVLMYVG